MNSDKKQVYENYIAGRISRQRARELLGEYWHAVREELEPRWAHEPHSHHPSLYYG